jgi:hypothetical protein
MSPNEKVEVISSWNDDIIWANGKIKHPSVLRLKNDIRKIFIRSKFTRKSLIKRDNGTCQYCSKKLIHSQITIDHIVPKSQKGKTSFKNCVVSCYECNSRKGSKTPEQAGMILLKKPEQPAIVDNFLSIGSFVWHNDWDFYIKS